MPKEDKEDNSGNYFAVCVCCLLAGALIASLVIYNLDSDRADLESCQKELPRSQYCVMLAVPSSVAIKTEVDLG